MTTNHEQAIRTVVQDRPVTTSYNGQSSPAMPNAEKAREYLRGNCEISELYPYLDEYRTVMDYYKYKPGYIDSGNDEKFYNRCMAFLALSCFQFIKVGEDVEGFFGILDSEKLALDCQVAGFAASYKSYSEYNRGCSSEALFEGAVKTFTRYLAERREETLAAFSQAPAEGRLLALRVLRGNAGENKTEILSYAADGSKLVREELLDILYGRKDWAESMIELLDAKKAALRELAIHVLAHWQEEDRTYREVLLQAMEKEKNTKVLTLLQNVLDIQESDMPKDEASKEELVKQLHKGGKKKTLAWAYETPFSAVHKTSGEVADEEYLQAVLLCYASQNGCGISKSAELLAKDLVENEFAVYINELFDKWLAAGAESKKKWALYAAAIHGGEDVIRKIQHQLQEWPQAARGAIAAEAVKALALNPSPSALLIVDGISRKFKFKQVKAAAGAALEFAASQLGISREELSDRIVPDLGFDENIERVFDYGTRSFKVRLTTALDIEVYDENEKKLKNLPAPGKKDDEEKEAAAYEEFKQLKKQLKTTIASQKARLEYALSVKREWGTEAWRNLFVKNPLMHQFATGLIWGVYENGGLVQCFRYMEDGSFNTVDEDEYELPENACIGLVHPIELSDEEKEAWKQQLEDYEITQPVEQLCRAVYYVEEEERDRKSLERFGGCILKDLSLNGKLTALGWYRGSVQDAGGFYTYYREDAELGMGVELNFSGSFIGMMDEDVTIYDVRFYKAGTVERGSYVYDEADKERSYFLKDVPPRYFSEIVYQLALATASSTEKDEDWKKNVRLI